LGTVSANFAVAVANGGTITSASPTTADNSFGCARLTLTTNNLSRAALSQTPNLNWGQGVVSYGARVQLNSLSGGGNSFTARIGFGNVTGAGNHTAGAWFQYDNTGSNWFVATDSSSSSTSVPVAANTWYLLQIVSNASTATFTYYINGVSVGTATSAAGLLTRIGLNTKYENNGTGTPTGSSLFVDYITLECPVTGGRGSMVVV
jgi:hypothetical protein